MNVAAGEGGGYTARDVGDRRARTEAVTLGHRRGWILPRPSMKLEAPPVKSMMCGDLCGALPARAVEVEAGRAGADAEF